MNKLRLSNSQINTYTDCQKKWYLDKQLRLRPNWKASPLLFGSALDEAVESILLKKEGTYVENYLSALNNFDINGVKKVLPRDILDVRFTAGDVQIELLEAKNLDEIGAFCDDIGIDMPDTGEFLEFCKQQRKNKDPLDTLNQKLYNYIAYTSLKVKGIMMLEKLDEWISLNVAEVHSVQKKIEIENEHGDMFIGYLDFVVTLTDGRKVLIDLKSSSNTTLYYPPDSAATSRQLGIYSQEEAIPDVAYLIADKKIRKRDPRVRIAFVEGVITEEHLDDVFEEIEEVTIEIKEKLVEGEAAFEKNLDSCMNFNGCQYFNYCKKGGMKGLEFVKK